MHGICFGTPEGRAHHVFAEKRNPPFIGIRARTNNLDRWKQFSKRFLFVVVVDAHTIYVQQVLTGPDTKQIGTKNNQIKQVENE